MARIRTIKPEFWVDEKLSPLSPITRLVFLGLISQADDAGRLVDNPRLIDGLLFPETEDSSRESLDVLCRLGRILRYQSSSGQKLIQIVGWPRHQKVQNPSVYVLPAPDEQDVVDAETTGSSLDPHESLVRDGVESQVPIPDPRSPIPDPRSPDGGAADASPAVESNPKAKKGTQLPDSWQPKPRHHDKAKAEGVSFGRELEKFRAQAKATGRVMKDWDAAFDTWLLKAADWKRERGGALQGTDPGPINGAGRKIIDTAPPVRPLGADAAKALAEAKRRAG
jgi:hypothetical protein